jgi:hypothetical protein
MIQKPKKWFKKPKVDPLNPNLEGKDGYFNMPWDFSTRNRDRPSGHVSMSWSGYYFNTDRYKFYARRNNRFFIAEGLTEQERF